MYGPLKRLITVAALTLIACLAFATATQESAMEEPAAFDWLRMYDHSYQDIANEDNPLFLFLEDKFNVDINLIHYHYDVFRQRRDVLVASGDMADLFAAWDFDLATYGERLVRPYNDRLAAGDLPSFQAVLERNPGAQATLTEADGNMYNFPRFRGYPWIRKAPILRRDLLRAGGFDGDTDWQAQFEAGFPYQETEDQITCIEAVKADMENHVMWYIRTAAKIWGERDRSKVAAQYANYNDILEWLDVVPFEEVYDNLGMFGTPDAVAEKVRWMRDEGGVGQLMNFMGFGGLSQEKVLRNMRLFAEEVMPRFKQPERPAQAGAARG